MEDQKIKEILIEKSEAFRRLYLRHQEMEAKLLHCQNRPGRTDEELQEETELKKRKLKLKDDMQKQIFTFRQRLA